jgi:hypothetical protein
MELFDVGSQQIDLPAKSGYGEEGQGGHVVSRRGSLLLVLLLLLRVLACGLE